MAIDYCEKYLPDLPAFRDKIAAFAQKEVSVAEYKGFSGGYGSYAQRGANMHMLRLRMAGGRMTMERFAGLAEIIEKFDVDMLKLTTCQCVQVHNLKPDVVADAMEIAWKHDMISRGGGGDFPRNVMMSSRAGVDPDELFDVLPYAEAAAQFLLGCIPGPKMPRKLKVCFSANGKNEPHATFRDMGFVAREDGYFDLYICGGLGNNPITGVKAVEKVDPTKICFYIKAFRKTFMENGNYKNRGRARTRYMQIDMGAEALLEAFNKNLEEAFAGEDLTIVPKPYEVTKTGNKEMPVGGRVYAQKQQGLYSVKYQPIGGKWDPQYAIALYKVIKDMDQVEVRVTPEESMYIINLNADEAKQVLAVTSDGAKTLFETSVACVGSVTCQQGIGDSQGLLKACVERVRQENFADGVLPQIHISGCPSSCSAHQIAAIGFRGGKKQTADGPKDAFSIAMGGCPLQGQEVLANVGSMMFAADIPQFLVDLGYMVSAENTTYAEWIKDHQDQMNELVASYVEKKTL